MAPAGAHRERSWHRAGQSCQGFVWELREVPWHSRKQRMEEQMSTSLPSPGETVTAGLEQGWGQRIQTNTRSCVCAGRQAGHCSNSGLFSLLPRGCRGRQCPGPSPGPAVCGELLAALRHQRGPCQGGCQPRSCPGLGGQDTSLALCQPAPRHVRHAERFQGWSCGTSLGQGFTALGGKSALLSRPAAKGFVPGFPGCPRLWGGAGAVPGLGAVPDPAKGPIL